jgi:hypothetical protein
VILWDASMPPHSKPLPIHEYLLIPRRVDLTSTGEQRRWITWESEYILWLHWLIDLCSCCNVVDIHKSMNLW